MRLPKLHVEKTKLKEFIEKAKKDFGFIESKIENLTLVKDLTKLVHLQDSQEFYLQQKLKIFKVPSIQIKKKIGC